MHVWLRTCKCQQSVTHIHTDWQADTRKDPPIKLLIAAENREQECIREKCNKGSKSRTIRGDEYSTKRYVKQAPIRQSKEILMARLYMLRLLEKDTDTNKADFKSNVTNELIRTTKLEGLWNIFIFLIFCCIAFFVLNLLLMQIKSKI